MKMQKIIVVSGLTALMATFPLRAFTEDGSGARAGEQSGVSQGQSQSGLPGQNSGMGMSGRSDVSQGALQDNMNDSSTQSPRARMGEKSDVSQSAMQEDVREIVREMVANAINGDVEDYVDYLSDEDRERMEATTPSTEFQGVSDSFSSRWQSQYSRSFESGLNQLNVPVTIQSLTDKTARVSVEGVELALVRGGWFDMAWKIDAPNSLTMETLHSRLREAATRVESGGAGAAGATGGSGVTNRAGVSGVTGGSQGNETQILRRAVSEILKPVSLTS